MDGDGDEWHWNAEFIKASTTKMTDKICPVYSHGWDDGEESAHAVSAEHNPLFPP